MLVRLAIFIAFAIPVSVIDIREGRIPDALSLGCAALLALELALFDSPALLYGVSGAAACAAFLALVRATTKGLGLGDVKFGLAIGLACGPVLAFFALLFASAAALAVALPLLALKKTDRKAKLPFGPFLAFGGALALALGATGILAA